MTIQSYRKLFSGGIFAGYVEAALWSSTDDQGEPLDRRFTALDISAETMYRMIQDCAKFDKSNEYDITEAARISTLEHIGHDFWLTRNGHGAGFWDGDYPEDLGQRLTEASKAFGSFDLYIGDDGKLYA